MIYLQKVENLKNETTNQKPKFYWQDTNVGQFTWPDGPLYTLEVALNSAFVNPMRTYASLLPDAISGNNIEFQDEILSFPHAKYYWRVKKVAEGIWSDVGSFLISPDVIEGELVSESARLQQPAPGGMQTAVFFRHPVNRNQRIQSGVSSSNKSREQVTPSAPARSLSGIRGSRSTI